MTNFIRQQVAKSQRKRSLHPEDALQRQVADYLKRFCPVLWLHVPNGGYRGRIEAARLIGLGLRPGASDLLFCLPPGGQIGAIELKIKPNRPTPAQKDFLQRVIHSGGRGSVCYSFNEVMATLESWGVRMTHSVAGGA